MFQTNAKRFYREVGKPKTSVNTIPSKDDLKSFWDSIWGQEKKYNASAEWIKNTEKANVEVPEQEWQELTVKDLKLALTKSQKWKSPGVDKVPNFWLNSISSSHKILTKLLNDIVRTPSFAPTWLCQGTIFLLPKADDTADPKNFRPFSLRLMILLTQKIFVLLHVFEQPIKF